MKFPNYIQLDSMDCGAACLQIIAKYYGRYFSQQTMRRLCHITRNGVSLRGVSDAAEAIGFRTIGAKLTWEQLAQEAMLPCIVHWNQMHYIVVYAIKKRRGQYLEFMGDKTKSIGNIKTHSLSLSSLAQTALSHNPFDDPKCLSCSILPICGGGCPNSRARKEKGEDVSVCSPLKDKVHDMLNAYLNQAMPNKEND